jgi:hypothetical protein
MSKKQRNSRAKTSMSNSHPASADPTKDPDFRDWMTREQGSDFLGVSIQTLRNYERRGRLNPQHMYRADGYGIERRVTVYDPEEINKLPRGGRKQRLNGDLAARVFEMFNSGRNLRDVVVDLRESPSTIKDLYALWREGDSPPNTNAGGNSRAELAVRCFIMLNEGKTLQEIVIALREDPEVIQNLKERWFDDGGVNMTITPASKKILENLVGPFKTVADLIDQVTITVQRLTP